MSKSTVLALSITTCQLPYLLRAGLFSHKDRYLSLRIWKRGTAVMNRMLQYDVRLLHTTEAHFLG